MGNSFFVVAQIGWPGNPMMVSDHFLLFSERSHFCLLSLPQNSFCLTAPCVPNPNTGGT